MCLTHPTLLFYAFLNLILVQVICYCFPIFVNIFVQELYKMTMYQTLIYQCIAAVFLTQPVSAKEVTISSITIMTFCHKRIIVVPSLACFHKMTEEDQEKAAFYLEHKYHYVWITMEFVVLIFQKCSKLSWMKVVLKCSQRTYRYFNQMAIKVLFRLKWPKSITHSNNYS